MHWTSIFIGFASTWLGLSMILSFVLPDRLAHIRETMGTNWVVSFLAFAALYAFLELVKWTWSLYPSFHW